MSLLEPLAPTVVWILQLYLLVGAIWALRWTLGGIERIDPAARGAGLAVRLLWIPGLAALWPLFLRRWLRRSGPPEERNAHRDVAGSPPPRRDAPAGLGRR